ncbi:MAG: FHA domain-containing protein [Caldilineaceae bacterium]|nr:FHA domain-containing protein [Caldilineaceae bacterium]
MNHPPQWDQWRRRMAASLIVMLLGLVSGTPVLAQTAPPPTIRITHIDVSRFPEVAIRVVGDHLTDDLATLSATLQEDGAPVSITSDAMAPVGIQVALVLDAAGNVTLPGPTGEARYVEVGRAARHLVQQGILSADYDWLTSVAFNQEKAIAALSSWSQDHQAVADSLYVYQPVAIGNTPLFDLLRFALKLFDDPLLPPGQERAIVVFSDGIDVISTTGLVDAVNLAAQQNIRIHPVMLGPEVAAQRKNLEYLSTMTDGQYAHLASLENLDPLWQTLAKGQQQRILIYRSQQATPRDVTVALTLPDGRALTATRNVPGTSLLPITVNAILDMEGSAILKYAEAHDTPLAQLGPQQLAISASFRWDDGYPRRLRRVEYQVGERIEVREEPSFEEPFLFPIDTFDTGSYSVRVRAIDELGLIGESQPQLFSIEVVRPPAPTPTPDEMLVVQATNAVQVAAAATQEAVVAATRLASESERADVLQATADDAIGQVQTLTWTTIAATAFGVIALAYAIYVLSSRDRRRQATQIITGTIAAATEPFRPRRGGASQEPRAQLVLVDDGGTPGMPAVIPLARAGVRIGRDPAVVNVPLADRRVSKLHCRIVEDGPTSGYRILDEGSTSGTYVNDQEVDIHGRVLQANDVVGIGPLIYRFEIVGLQVAGNAEPSRPFDREDNTEPYVRIPTTASQTEVKIGSHE